MPPRSLGERQIQAYGSTGEMMKTEMLIKTERRLVLGIDDEREDRRLGAYGARDGIDDQRGPESLSPKLLIDREPADKARRENRIAGQSPGLLREQFAER